MLIIRIYRKLLFIAEKIYTFLSNGSKQILPDIYYDLFHNMVEKVIIHQISSVWDFDKDGIEDNSKKKDNNIIWLMWWQTEDIPLLISKNIDRIKQQDTYKTVVINKSNITNYLDIPEVILKGVKDSRISFAAFSDFVRMSLLYKYGGIWMDSTILFANNNVESLLNKEFITIKNINTPFGHKFVSKGRWTGYLIGGQSGQEVFKFVRDCFYYYMVNNIKLPDYFLIDYLLDIAEKNNIGGFATKINSLSENNQNHDRLDKFMNEPFDSLLYESLTNNTSFFKLSHKKEYLKSNKGQITFFGVLYGINKNDSI